MTALEDRRPVASTTTTSAHPAVLGQGLAQLLLEHPGIELASIRLIPSTEHRGVGIAGRIGPIAEPVCDCYPGGCTPDTYEGPQHHCRVHGHGPDCCESCHTHDGHPHTEYCKLVDFASQLTHLELNGPIEGPHYAEGAPLPEVTVHPHVATCTAGPDCPTCDNPAGISYLRPACSAPAADRGDGRGCQTDNCPVHNA